MARRNRRSIGKRSKRLCAQIQNKGYTGVREAVRNPAHICTTCSRVARHQEILCDPDKL